MILLPDHAAGKPVDPSRFGGAGDDAAARAVRDNVNAAVEAGIQTLFPERERDPHRRLLARLWPGESELAAGRSRRPRRVVGDASVRGLERTWPAGAAAWMSRWVQLTDPPDWPGASTWRGRERAVARLEQVTSALRAASAQVTEARTIGDQVLAVFELRRDRDRSPTHPVFAALFEVDQNQIMRMRVFRDPDATLRVANQ